MRDDLGKRLCVSVKHWRQSGRIWPDVKVWPVFVRVGYDMRFNDSIVIITSNGMRRRISSGGDGCAGGGGGGTVVRCRHS